MKLQRKIKIKQRRPAFLRQEWFRHGNIRRKWLKWRRVRGGQSKLRTHIKGKGFAPHPGYGLPTELKHLHPSGLKEVMVNNVNEINGVDPKTCAIRIAGGVGNRKRLEIQSEAEKRNIKVLNQRKIAMKIKKEKPVETKPAQAPKTPVTASTKSVAAPAQAPKSPAAASTKGHEAKSK